MSRWGKTAAVTAFAAVGAAVWLSTSEPGNRPEDTANMSRRITQPVDTAEPERPVTSLTQEQRDSAMSPEVCNALNERLIGKVVDALDHLNKYTTGDYKLERNGPFVTPVIPDEPPVILRADITQKLRESLGAFAMEGANLRNYTGCDMSPAFSAISSYARIIEDYAKHAPEPVDPFLREPMKEAPRQIII